MEVDNQNLNQHHTNVLYRNSRNFCMIINPYSCFIYVSFDMRKKLRTYQIFEFILKKNFLIIIKTNYFQMFVKNNK